MSPRCFIAKSTCSRYTPLVYCSVWLMGSYSTPSSASASTMAALKCSAQFGYADPAGAGTAVSGLPMCCAHDPSMPGTPAGTLR
ncbi:hypothetical protein EES37_10630 [Streptomyces sp. ADI91-18]|nr:hypothetical protein EES37_10630 [Streptomyces sp. ADI91-18]